MFKHCSLFRHWQPLILELCLGFQANGFAGVNMIVKELSPWTGEFKSARQECAYRHSAAAQERLQIRLIWGLSTLFFCYYGLFDSCSGPFFLGFSGLLLFRATIVVVGSFIVFLSCVRLSWQLLDKCTWAVLIVVALLYAALVLLRNSSDRDLSGALILVIGIYLFSPNQFWRICFNGVFFSSAFVFVEYLLSNGKTLWWLGSSYLLPANILAVVCLARINYLQRLRFIQGNRLEAEVEVRKAAEAALIEAHHRSESLLLNILPRLIVEKLKKGDEMIASHYKEATVLFADIVGFTGLAERLDTRELIYFLNSVFCQFDGLAEKHGLEKIKTVGDAYMAVAGVPEPNLSHAIAAVAMAVEMQSEMIGLSEQLGFPVQLRIGIHTGPLVAGVIGRKKFAYDVWGDTVNTASRLESHSQPGNILVSALTRRHIGTCFKCSDVKSISIKGKGKILSYLVYGKQGADHIYQGEIE